MKWVTTSWTYRNIDYFHSSSLSNVFLWKITLENPGLFIAGNYSSPERNVNKMSAAVPASAAKKIMIFSHAQ